MIKHASFAFITLFWIVMNVLLWQSELGPGHDLASAVSPSVVWQKILSAPDDSSLSISFQGKKIGYARIRPSATEASGPAAIASEAEPEGIVRKLAEYSLDIDASIVVEALAKSVRMMGTFTFDPELKWKQFKTQTTIRPTFVELNGNAAAQEIWFKMKDGETEWIRQFTLAELRNPRALLSELNSPILAAMLPQILPSAQASPNLTLGLDWQAKTEWLRIGTSRVRVYRLEAKLLDRHQIMVLVSRVGEILRIEIPGLLLLVNEVLFVS